MTGQPLKEVLRQGSVFPQVFRDQTWNIPKEDQGDRHAGEATGGSRVATQGGDLNIVIVYYMELDKCTMENLKIKKKTKTKTKKTRTTSV